MERFWLRFEDQIWQGVISLIILLLFWILVSIGLNNLEQGRSYFDLRSILFFKSLLVGTVFLGRYLFYPGYRSESWGYWLIPLNFLILLGTWLLRVINNFNWGFLFLRVIDSFIWAVVLAVTIEVIAALLRFWSLVPKINYAVLQELWEKFWSDALKLGIWLMLLLGLTYYYLVNFYLVDVVLYSYLMVIPEVGLIIVFYSILLVKVNKWLKQDILTIDEEISLYLDWRSIKEDPQLGEKVPWFQYLLLTREYLIRLKQPVISIKTILGCLFCSGFLLAMPYLLGLIIEV